VVQAGEGSAGFAGQGGAGLAELAKDPAAVGHK